MVRTRSPDRFRQGARNWRGNLDSDCLSFRFPAPFPAPLLAGFFAVFQASPGNNQGPVIPRPLHATSHRFCSRWTAFQPATYLCSPSGRHPSSPRAVPRRRSRHRPADPASRGCRRERSDVPRTCVRVRRPEQCCEPSSHPPEPVRGLRSAQDGTIPTPPVLGLQIKRCAAAEGRHSPSVRAAVRCRAPPGSLDTVAKQVQGKREPPERTKWSFPGVPSSGWLSRWRLSSRGDEPNR